MAERREIRVPDIGDFDQVEVVEVLVKPGDRIALDDPLVSIESEKATMEIPSSAAGVLVELAVKEGDKVSQGSLLAILELASDAAADAGVPADRPAAAPLATPSAKAEAKAERKALKTAEAKAASAPVAAAPVAGKSPAVPAGAGDTAGAIERPLAPEKFDSIELDRSVRKLSPAAANPVPDRTGLPHASPLVRRFARELGVPVAEAQATGPHGRVLVEDVKRHVHDRFTGDGASPSTTSGAVAGTGTGVPPVPFVDPARFGPVHEQALTRIQKVSGPALHRSWLNVPHVTQHDEADITELERFRRDRKDLASGKGVKLSPLLFVMKAVVIALREFSTLRSTLSPERDRLLVKDYFHLGIAVDTDQGLVVPVDPRRRSQGRPRARRRAPGDGRTSPPPQAHARRSLRRLLHDLEPRRHRGHRLLAHRQRARGGDSRSLEDPGEAGLARAVAHRSPRPTSARGRCGIGPRSGWSVVRGQRSVRAAAVPAAVALVRPPSGRRGPGRPLHDAPRRDPRRPDAAPALRGVRSG